MGWIMAPDKPDKPQIYDYSKTESNPSYIPSSNPAYFTWMIGNLWRSDEECVCYYNDTAQPMKISKVSIKTVSCHSGGSSYWSSNGLVDSSHARGYGGTYYSYIRITNDNGKTYQKSTVGEHIIPNVTSSNMNSKGSSTSKTAVFGNPPFTGYAGLTLHDYIIEDCPEILPGGKAYVHLGIKSFNDGTNGGNTTIRFILDPTVMEVEFEPTLNGYIWRFNENHKWELIRPIYIYTSQGWKSVEGE